MFKVQYKWYQDETVKNPEHYIKDIIFFWDEHAYFLYKWRLCSTEVEIVLNEVSASLKLNLSLTAWVRAAIGVQGNNMGKYMVFTLNSLVQLKPDGFECLKKKMGLGMYCYIYTSK